MGTDNTNLDFNITEAINRLRAAHDADDLREYEGALADGDPFNIEGGRVYVDPGDTISVDLQDDSADGFRNYFLGVAEGLYAELR